MGLFTLLVLLGVVAGSPSTSLEDELTEEGGDTQTAEDREKHVGQLLNDLEEVDERLRQIEVQKKEAAEVRDAILCKLKWANGVRRMNGEARGFTELPAEILTKIFSYLPFRDRMIGRLSHKLCGIEEKAPGMFHMEGTEIQGLAWLNNESTVSLSIREKEENIVKKKVKYVDQRLSLPTALNILQRAARTVIHKSFWFNGDRNFGSDYVHKIIKVLFSLHITERFEIQGVNLNMALHISMLEGMMNRNWNLKSIYIHHVFFQANADDLREVYEMTSEMRSLSKFRIKVKCAAIDGFVEEIYGVNSSFLKGEIDTGDLRTTLRDAEIIAVDGPILCRRELEETGRRGRRVTMIKKVENDAYQLEVVYQENERHLSEQLSNPVTIARI